VHAEGEKKKLKKEQYQGEDNTHDGQLAAFVVKDDQRPK